MIRKKINKVEVGDNSENSIGKGNSTSRSKSIKLVKDEEENNTPDLEIHKLEKKEIIPEFEKVTENSEQNKLEENKLTNNSVKI